MTTIYIPVHRKRKVSPSVHPLLRLSRYSSKYRPLALQAITCSILNKLFDIAVPVLIGTVIDVVVWKQASLIAQLGVKSTFEQLLILAFLALIVWSLKSAFQYAYHRLWRELAQKLRLHTYSHLQKLACFEEDCNGGLMSILKDDINQLERFLDGGIDAVVQITTQVLIISFAFFILSPNVAWLGMIPMPFFLCASNPPTSLHATLSLLSRGLGRGELHLNAKCCKDENNGLSNQRAIASYTDSTTLSRVIIFAGFITTLFIGGKEVLNGNLSVGSYSLLLYLTQSLLWPLSKIISTFDCYQAAMVSTNRVMELLDSQE